MVGRYQHVGQALPVSHPHPHYPLVKSSLLLFKLDRFPSIGWLNPFQGAMLVRGPPFQGFPWTPGAGGSQLQIQGIHADFHFRKLQHTPQVAP